MESLEAPRRGRGLGAVGGSRWDVPAGGADPCPRFWRFRVGIVVLVWRGRRCEVAGVLFRIPKHGIVTVCHGLNVLVVFCLILIQF